MNKDVKFMTVVVALSSVLLLSSAYLIEFQKWLAFNQSTSDTPLEHTLVNSASLGSGIRSVVNQTFINETLNLALPPSVNNSSISEPQDFLSNKDNDAPLILGESHQPPSKAQTSKVVSSGSALLPANNDSTAVNNEVVAFKKALSNEAYLQTTPFVAELDNEILVEFPAGYSKLQKKHALARLLTLSNIDNIERLLSKEAINTKETPYFYKRVLNQYQSAIRYPAQGYRYAEYLLLHHIENISEPAGDYQLIRIPLHTPKVPSLIEPYYAWVEQYSKEFGVSPELVYAVMQTESYFNPKAVSQSDALGLMQIKQKAAGRDVYKYIDNRHGYPSRQVLFNPKENIRIGVAYMGLLKDKYLKQVRNPESKEMLMIASYNGGLSKALKVFGESPQQALRRINELYPRNIYHKLRYSHTSDETRNYIEKVLKNKKKFAQIMQTQA